MAWEGKVGDAFFRPDGLKDHLNVVLFDPNHFPDLGFGNHLCIVKVNITTIYEGKYFDPTCIVRKGEHPFIDHDSFVYYQKLEIEHFSHIHTCVNNGIWRPADPISGELLLRMQNGVKNSGDTPKKYKKYIIK
ncbi:hypothetical protein LVY74_02115 [Acinetobacter sp. ME22]|uniref:hypothetical protein n=1 Tax=Acinetobacter sp. ME22 TaxID=2904802 RepID=UPI001EDA91D7|nr:hypothetical protein [Acinetobacter sp. ME22]MCG2572352.1 hypothetical protein [Acinetobacter sp. ME22]